MDAPISALMASPKRRAEARKRASVVRRFTAEAISPSDAVGGNRRPAPFASTRRALAPWSRAMGKTSSGKTIDQRAVDGPVAALRYHCRNLLHDTVMRCALQQMYVLRGLEVRNVQIGPGGCDGIDLDQSHGIENPLNQLSLALRSRAASDERARAIRPG